MQVGFLMRIEGQCLTADVAECLLDYEFAFEGPDEGVPGMYYRCDCTRDLQAHFGDMLHRIHDLEVKALRSKNGSLRDALAERLAIPQPCNLCTILFSLCDHGLPWQRCALQSWPPALLFLSAKAAGCNA
jgi:hypothetical protein